MKKSVTLFTLLLLLSACRTDPQPINYGSDLCAFCKMTVIDPHFGAEYISSKGKVYKFDSAECMLRQLAEQQVEEKTLQELLVTDHAHPGNLIDARTALFLRSDSLASPMGEGVSAYDSKVSLEISQKAYGGEMLSWEKLREVIK